MLKFTVDLPDGVRLTVEATEPEIYREIMSQIMEHLSASLTGNRENIYQATTHDEDELSTRSSISDNSRFIKFCLDLSPVGDMRRVVVAAEGASKFLGINQVSERELSTLFESLGWRKPNNFLHTLRNAGRKNFQWLQRVPGNAGYYALTNNGRNAVMPSNDD